ncbi:hypothetical protein [Halomarina ordinaria]|uniref:Small CPxCG-related zinc finger protein n=1 Tax=Halomarina ordinaria TaxID=3033939 RepID=A0ABD5UER2_9EURY|nr:hypothetical protein [Halomarina sp. PSRA2]
MNGECYFCRGIVLAGEADDLVLDRHGDHRVYVHRECAEGHGLVDEPTDEEGVAVTCPECGVAETH